MLPCGHTFCFECTVTQLVKVARHTYMYRARTSSSLFTGTPRPRPLSTARRSRRTRGHASVCGRQAKGIQPSQPPPAQPQHLRALNNKNQELRTLRYQCQWSHFCESELFCLQKYLSPFYGQLSELLLQATRVKKINKCSFTWHK